MTTLYFFVLEAESLIGMGRQLQAEHRLSFL